MGLLSGAVVFVVGLVDVLAREYYAGNELLLLAGLLFGVDARRAGAGDS